MPMLPSYGSFPLTLRDYLVKSPRKGELLLNYQNNELYFVRISTGEVVSVAKTIYNKILSSKIKNSKLIVFDADKLVPQPGKDEIVPPKIARDYNAMYLVIKGRRKYDGPDAGKLTAVTRNVKQGKKFLGKFSGYVEEEEE